VEAIGFFNRYENFVGLDTASSGGDLSGAARSLGGADVAGIEAALQTGFEGPWNLRFGLSANYTYTHTAFLEDIPFGAFNPRFNGAEAGDPIPYVPEHLGAVRGTIDHPDWGGLTLGARGQADTLDRVAADPGDPTAFNDGYAVVDLTARFFATDWLTVYTRIDNLFDDTYLVSRLPFGARPGRPFTALVGVKLRAEPPRD
jgi:Fe(3+) dicitrate transport protein